MSGCGDGGSEHDQHMVQCLQLEIVPEYPSHDGDHVLKLFLVHDIPGPGRRKPLLILNRNIGIFILFKLRIIRLYNFMVLVHRRTILILRRQLKRLDSSPNYT